MSRDKGQLFPHFEKWVAKLCYPPPFFAQFFSQFTKGYFALKGNDRVLLLDSYENLPHFPVLSCYLPPPTVRSSPDICTPPPLTHTLFGENHVVLQRNFQKLILQAH